MTFKEKLQKEHPDCIDAELMGGCFGCPSAYKYEAEGSGLCKKTTFSPGLCTKCWNREIPGTESIGFVRNYQCKWVLPVPKEDPDFVKIAEKAYARADIAATKRIGNLLSAGFLAGIKSINMPDIKQVIFNDPATIVIWADGEKTVVKCQNGEPYDPEKGLAMAISKRALGNKHEYYNIFKHWLKKYKKRAKSIWGYKRDSEHCLHNFKCGVCGHAVAIPFSKDIIGPPEVCPSCGSKNGEV